MANKKPQEIKIKKQKEKVIEKDAWKKTNKLVTECNLISEEINDLLDKLCKQYASLNEKLNEAYASAPEKDTHLFTSPIGPTKNIHALKAHMVKKGLQIQAIYMGDPNKLKNFADHISEATKWILKYSKV